MIGVETGVGVGVCVRASGQKHTSDRSSQTNETAPHRPRLHGHAAEAAIRGRGALVRCVRAPETDWAGVAFVAPVTSRGACVTCIRDDHSQGQHTRLRRCSDQATHRHEQRRITSREDALYTADQASGVGRRRRPEARVEKTTNRGMYTTKKGCVFEGGKKVVKSRAKIRCGGAAAGKRARRRNRGEYYCGCATVLRCAII